MRITLTTRADAQVPNDQRPSPLPTSLLGYRVLRTAKNEQQFLASARVSPMCRPSDDVAERSDDADPGSALREYTPSTRWRRSTASGLPTVMARSGAMYVK